MHEPQDTVAGSVKHDPPPGQAGATKKPPPLTQQGLLGLARRENPTMSETLQTPGIARRVRIPASDERDLRWYFEHGIRRIERASNMQAQLDRLEFYFRQARPCVKCGGDRERHVGGSGFITDGTEFKRAFQIATIVMGEEFDIPGDITCPTCGGRGWVVCRRGRRKPITARPTGGSLDGSVGTQDTGGNDSMARFGAVDRRLAAVRRLDAVAYAGFEPYYSPSGGSLTELWWLTPAGRTMLRGRQHDVPAREFFRILRHRQERSPDANRALQFEAADKQADEVLRRMAEVWVASGGPR